jgi:hypothetical protein
MADIEINHNNDARSAEKMEFLIKEVIKLKLKIKDLEKNDNNYNNDDTMKNNMILTELSKKNINIDSLPVVLF